MKKRTKKILIISFIALLIIVFTFSKVTRISPIALGMHNETYTPIFSDEAIKGYDPVAYLTEQKAVAGDKAYSYEWNNANWSFSSEENKNLFSTQPEKYAPQYGGYCALAVSKGITAFISPESFEIVDDKLYLFADDAAHKKWKVDKAENLKKSDANWK